jgi:hypothetical protein
MYNLNYGWNILTSGFNVDTPLALTPLSFPTVTVRIRKSARWIQEGTTLSSGTALRVWVGSGITDILVDASGNFTTPFGWVSGSNEVSRSFSIPTPPYPLENGLGQNGNYINLGSNPPLQFGGVLNPPGGAGELNNLMQRTSSEVVVYAYEVTAPTPEFTNPAGAPKWDYIEDAEIAQIVAVDGSGNFDPNFRDQQEVSVFSAQLVISQSAYGVTAISALTSTLSELYVPAEAKDASAAEIISGSSGEVIITIDPSGILLGTPIYNPNPFTYTPPNTIAGFPPRKPPVRTPKPPRDSGSGVGDGSTRPIIFPSTGGGGTPANDQFIALQVTPDPIIHLDTDVGTQRTQPFTIENLGTVSVGIDEISSTNVDNSFSFGMNSPISIPFTINPNQILSGISYFLPADDLIYTEIGNLKAGGVILRSFSVNGTGTTTGNPGDPILRSISLRGDVTSNGSRNFLERVVNSTTTTDIFAVNTGSTPIVLNSVSIGGSSTFTSTGVTAGFNLQPGQEVAIPVTFIPISAQQYLGTFSLNSNADTSPQSDFFNPSTGDIFANLTGEGVPPTVLTRIMAFNVQNNGTFEDVLAGGSATSEITATITSIGNATILIGQFQIEQPFTLDLGAFGNFSVGNFQFYNLEAPLILPPGVTSQPFTIIFTPPTATNYVDDVLVVSNKTIGPESFEVRGIGTFEVPDIEPPEPPGPPDDEPPPGQEFDPGTAPSSALDGNGAACIPKECGVVYVYEYSSNGKIVT